MIENVHNNHVAHMTGMGAVPHADATNRPAADNSDATLQVNFADMVNQAMQAGETGTDAVEKAKELIQSGRLTSVENIRSAAENVLRFGI